MKTKNFKKLRNKCHLRNLLLVALSDGKLDTAEAVFLTNKAAEMGIEDSIMGQILKQRKRTRLIFPENLGARISLLYDLVCMMLADGLVDERELETCREIANKMNILPSVVDSILKDLLRHKEESTEAVFSDN